MKTHVIFIKSSLFDNGFFKCICYPCCDICENNDTVQCECGVEIIKVHKEVYPSFEFKILEKIPLYNETLFNEYIKKIPQNKTAFITVVSFNDNSTLPNMVFIDEQRPLIKKVIENINELTACIPRIPLENNKPRGMYVYDYPCPCPLFVDLYYLINDHNQESIKYIIMNQDFTFNKQLFIKTFPELKVIVYNNFPNVPLARDMLDYQINSCINQDLVNQDLINLMFSRINQFFSGNINVIVPIRSTEKETSGIVHNGNVDVDTNVNTNVNTNVVTDVVTDVVTNVELRQYNAVDKFAKKCVEKENSSIRSTLLYNKFKEFCCENKQEIELTQKKFSILFTQISKIEPTRDSKGMIFKNILVK